MIDASVALSSPRHSRALLVALCMLSTIGCSITEPGRATQSNELARNRQRWASAALHDYEFDYQLRCFCAPDVTESVHVVVRDDRISSVTRARDGLPALRQFGTWPTIPDLFENVRAQLERKADRLDVTY